MSSWPRTTSVTSFCWYVWGGCVARSCGSAQPFNSHPTWPPIFSLSQLDLRELANCVKACEGAEWVFNLAADMGGMGFIQSNHSVILYNNT